MGPGVAGINIKRIIIVLFGTFGYWQIPAQFLPVEVMAGHQRAGVDILWFRNFSSVKEKKSPWLFFHRTRASSDYHNTTSFGVTNALSYNFKNGIGLVTTIRLLQSGVAAKAGIQYAKTFTNGSLFSWLVTGNNTAHYLSADWFLLLRWSPPIKKEWKWFLQTEILSSLDKDSNKNFIQRFRLGLGYSRWQFGLASDLSESGNNKLITAGNNGLFLRKEFQ